MYRLATKRNEKRIAEITSQSGKRAENTTDTVRRQWHTLHANGKYFWCLQMMQKNTK